MKNKFMALALKEAKKAYLKDEVPVGCVIVRNEVVIARGYNKKENKQCAVEHAEIIAIKKACKKINNWRLDGCELYVTLEPCAMCMGAIMQSHISNVYYGAKDNAMGACFSKIRMQDINFCNPPLKVEGQILEEESRELIQKFFKELRRKKS